MPDIGLTMHTALVFAAVLTTVSALLRLVRHRWTQYISAGAWEAALICLLFALWQYGCRAVVGDASGARRLGGASRHRRNHEQPEQVALADPAAHRLHELRRRRDRESLLVRRPRGGRLRPLGDPAGARTRPRDRAGAQSACAAAGTGADMTFVHDGLFSDEPRLLGSHCADCGGYHF